MLIYHKLSRLTSLMDLSEYHYLVGGHGYTNSAGGGSFLYLANEEDRKNGATTIEFVIIDMFGIL